MRPQARYPATPFKFAARALLWSVFSTAEPRVATVNDNLTSFFQKRQDLFPLTRRIDLERFLTDALDRVADSLPVPAKVFLADELAPQGYGFPVSRSAVLDELGSKLEQWIDQEIDARTGGTASRRKADASLQAYVVQLKHLTRNAIDSSILADYHAVFWLVHTCQTSRLFSAIPRRAMTAAPEIDRDHAHQLKYLLVSKWAGAAREIEGEFVRLILDNPLIAAEEFLSGDLRELRSYVVGHLHRDFTAVKRSLDDLRSRVAELMSADRLFRRAVMQLGYPDGPPALVTVLDARVQQLLTDHPSIRVDADYGTLAAMARRVLEYLIVYQLRRAIVWMRSTPEGENVSDDGGAAVIYSKALRPMDFGRRGIVEPIVYRYGLVYDITAFTETLGQIAREGKKGEEVSYRQMLEFQRDLADIARRHGLQFEKFLGDGAFYTSRRAARTMEAAIEIQQFYARTRARGFAFDRGMRIALNYGYYRLLPMQVSTDGTEIKEFYGPGIVELTRLTSGKTTKDLEDIQQLLLSHGYDQMEVYHFFAPLARSVSGPDTGVQQREFYAYVNENGHLINEGIVVSIPFLKQLSAELLDDRQKVYRLRAPWAIYLGLPSAVEATRYLGVRLIGSVSLKGIGDVEVGEVVQLAASETEVSLIDEAVPLLTLLQQERNRTAARAVAAPDNTDLVVCQSPSGILVGEWDPVSEEVRRPIQLVGDQAERFGLLMPLTHERVESQSAAYQNLYRKLSRFETLPSFSVGAIRQNANFSGFIIGASIEPL